MLTGLQNKGVLLTAQGVVCAVVILSIIPCYAGGYGALAYDSSNGASGWSWDHPNQSSANAGALQNCAQYGSNCQVVAEVPGGCGAYAMGADSSRAAIRSTLAAAQRAALNLCDIYGGLGDCVVRVSVCNSPPGSVMPQPSAPESSFPDYSEPRLTEDERIRNRARIRSVPLFSPPLTAE